MIDRDREVQALALPVTHGRDADGSAVTIEKGSSAVPWVDGSIRLHQRDAAALTHRADDPPRDGILQRAERRSDGDRFLADAQILRRAEWNPRLTRVGVRDLQNRN